MAMNRPSNIKRRRSKISKLSLFVVILIVLLIIILVRCVTKFYNEQMIILQHPIKHQTYVEKYADEYGVDKYLIYAIIKCESSFNENAKSNVGARGLMQIMNDTYDWIKYRLDDDSVAFDDMYDPEKNIRYGTYLVYYLFELFEDEKCVVSAYHAGQGNVESWLQNSKYSKDGKTLEKIPTDDTAHYYNKIEKAYLTYLKIYEGAEKADNAVYFTKDNN